MKPQISVWKVPKTKAKSPIVSESTIPQLQFYGGALRSGRVFFTFQITWQLFVHFENSPIFS